ncbi:MAG TPA: hypothetical protein VND68_05805, partial [Chloroflexia bacterium]|nr:hypothetical protein [Chloroflexia bacterium]
MKNYLDVLSSERRNLRTVVYLLLAAMTLGLGLTFASAAHGAPQKQTEGRISGTVTLGSAGAEGVTVELRQHANSGAESLLATATTDGTGQYGFANQPSAPGDAFYYIEFKGGAGTLANWRTFPIIYLNGTDFTVPTVDLSDVVLVEPAGGATVGPGSKLKWNARRAGETYRVYIYAAGQGDKPVVDSGKLGGSAEYTLGDGGLAEGQYEAIVQVRDAVIGYGNSRARFQFTFGKAAVALPTPQQDQGGAASAQPTTEKQITLPTVQPTSPDGGEAGPADNSQQAQPTVETPAQAQPTAPAEPAARPEVKLRLSADKTSVDQGQSMVYVIEVHNAGDAAATDVIVTDKLPAGVAVDAAQMRSTHGSVAVTDNTVTAHVGELAPNGTAQVEIPVLVGPEAGSALSNQASAVYKQSSEAVQSNAYIAQVAEPLTVAQPAPTQEAQPTATQTAQSPVQQPQPPALAPATATTPAQPESTPVAASDEGKSASESASGQAPATTSDTPA